MYGPRENMQYWWHGFLGMRLLGILISVLLVFLLVYLIKVLFGKGRQNTEALDILERRYASGEINKAEFDQIKKDLNA